MAWIAWDLDGTLLEEQMEEMGGGSMPVPGAVETAMRYFNEGHRLTVFTSRFAPAPETERQRLKQQIEEELAAYGFPPMEVWTGTTKPMADLYISADAVTFDGDYDLLQAQVDYMLSERGLAGIDPMTGMPIGQDPMGEDTQMMDDTPVDPEGEV